MTTSTELPHNTNVAAMERPAADTGGPEAPPATSPMTPPIGGPGGIESQIAALSAQVDRLADALARAIEPTVVKGMGTPPTPPSGKVPVRSGEGLGGLSAGLGGRAGALQMWSSVDRIQLA